jgi:hypothetical protein
MLDGDLCGSIAVAPGDQNPRSPEMNMVAVRRGRGPAAKPADLVNRYTDPTMRYIAKENLWDAVALQCGISRHAVKLWRRVPPLRVIDVERAIGRPRRLIRPDLYPPETVTT